MEHGYGRKPASRPAIVLAPAAKRGEPRWPVALAIIVVAGLDMALPAAKRRRGVRTTPFKNSHRTT